MKLNGGISVGNLWTIVVTLVALAVLWGSNKTKVEHIEFALSNKAEKEVVNAHFEHIQRQFDRIENILTKE